MTEGNGIGRRACLAAIVTATAAELPAFAQAPLRIGWLSISPHQLLADFRARMAELGYVEGKNLQIEYRYAGGKPEFLPGLIDDLIEKGAIILAVSGNEATEAAVAHPKGVPIVFVSSDPTIAGLVPSLARPGGIATGISLLSEELGSKRVGLLREAMPSLSRLALLDPITSGADSPQIQVMTASAAKLGIATKNFRAVDPAELPGTLAAIVAEGWQGLIAGASPLFSAHAAELGALSLKLRLPAQFDNPYFVRAGALMSYGPDLPAAFRRQAELVVKLAKGAKVADMPVEQATKFNFAFNQTTAKTLGLSLSLPAMAYVDELVD
jgi:putative ABC transport system substrate-binding protein